MNLKKLALCFGLTCMFSIIGCNSEIFDKSAENTDSTSLNESGITQKISCGKVFDDEILCIEDLKCGEEETLKNSSDEDLPYRKFLEYKREYRKLDKDTNEYKTLAMCFAKIAFMYDKKGNIKVDMKNSDVKFINVNEKWFLMNAKKILSGEHSKTLVFIFSLYKQNKIGDFVYKFGGHLDVFCTSNGELGICTDMI